VQVDRLTVEVVHQLTDAGLFPFGECGNCGSTPVSLNFIDGRWRVTCPGCDQSWSATAVSWRDAAGAQTAGWSLTPSVADPVLLFDDRRNQVH
jgi:hypothetical protein